MIKEAIVKIVNKGDLTYDEAYAVMNEIMNGETTHRALTSPQHLHLLPQRAELRSESTVTVRHPANAVPQTVSKHSASISIRVPRSVSNF